MKCTLHESVGLHRVLRSTSKYFVLRVVCTLCTQSTSKYFCAQSLCTQSTSKYFCAQSTSKYVAKLQIATSSELYSLFMCTETSDQDNSRVGSPLESHWHLLACTRAEQTLSKELSEWNHRPSGISRKNAYASKQAQPKRRKNHTGLPFHRDLRQNTK